jgi:dipeptidyl aminopeptidase/acylaminoacyl peptidase
MHNTRHILIQKPSGEADMRAIRFYMFTAAAVAAFAIVAPAQSTSSTWTPEVHVSTRAVGSPEISPDGRQVVYTVNEAVMSAEKSEFVTQIWMATTDGKRNHQMTFAEKSSTNPKWSPDGSMIAFTSSRKDNKNNLFVMRVNGGEAEQLTNVKSAVGNFEWSPDGRSIAFTMTDQKSEDEEKNDKGRNDFRWIDENVKFGRLYVIKLEKGPDGKREPRKLTVGDRHVSSFDWSPDGTRIAFSHVTSPKVDHWPTADVSVVEVATGNVSAFAATEAAESAPRYSPDGKWLLLSVSELPIRWAQSNRIHIYPAGGGEPKVMAASHDGQPSIIGWTGDSSRVMLYEAKGTGSVLQEADVAAGTIREADYQDAVVTSVSMTKDGRIGAFVMQTADRAPEVYVLRDGDGLTQVSRANAHLTEKTVGRTEAIKWKSKDGREIEGLLTYPINYASGTRVPLILNVHGGPAGVFRRSFIGGRGAYPLAAFAERGYAILRPNPRGSSGYGVEFRRANIKDWAGMDYEDLMTGVDHVVAMGVADPDRLGVMGWSYGGYMTSMIITKTNRFKAASAGAPVTNLMSFNGTADIPSFIPDYFENEFWDNPAIYAKHSAVFNIKNAKTPTLIQHGENDVRVPISQGYELYTALKRQNVPTRMIVLPRQPHGINEPKLQIAVMQSNLEWFEEYLKK